MAINYTQRLGLGGSSMDRFTQMANLPSQMEARKAATRGQMISNEFNQERINALQDQNRFNDMYSSMTQYFALGGGPNEIAGPTPSGLPMMNKDQINFVQNRIAQGEAEGKDMSNTKAFLNLSPEQQIQSYSAMTQLGRQQGFLQPQSSAPQKNLIVKKVRLEDGKFYEVGFDPISGEAKSILGEANMSSGKDINVNVNTSDKQPQSFSSSEFQKGMGKNLAKQYEALTNDLMASQEQKQLTSVLLENLPKIKSYQTGVVGNFLLPLQEIAANAGMEIEGLNETQLVKGVLNKLATTVRKAGSGATSDLEFSAYKSTFGDASVENPKSLLNKAYYADVMNDYQIQKKTKKQELLERAGTDPNFNLSDIRSEMEKWDKEVSEVYKNKLYNENPYDTRPESERPKQARPVTNNEVFEVDF